MQGLLSVERLAARIQQGDEAIDGVMARSEAAGDDRLLLAAVRELRMNVEALARLATAGELEQHVRDLLDALNAKLAEERGGQTYG